jgi:cysteine-rich repeat protein
VSGLSAPACGDGVIDSGEACDGATRTTRTRANATARRTCAATAQSRTGVETCDDGNTAGGDGCAADCTVLDAETVPATGVGGAVLAVTTGAVATPGDPVETTIAVPAGATSGTVAITETTVPAAVPEGWCSSARASRERQ